MLFTGRILWPAGYFTDAVWGPYVQRLIIRDQVDVYSAWDHDTNWDGGNRLGSDTPTVWGFVRTDDPERADARSFGTADVALNDGSVRLAHPLDFDLSPGTDTGRSPALVYNSATVSARPVIELNFSGRLPFAATGATVRLVWNDQRPSGVTMLGETEPRPQDPVEFVIDRAILSASGGFTLAVQVADPVGYSGLYHWTADIVLTGIDPATDTVVTHQSRLGGWQPVVVRDNATDPNPFGAGWAIDGIDRLFLNQLKDAVLVSGAGDARVFAKSAWGSGYTTPAEDASATLQFLNDDVNGDGKRDPRYLYTAPDTTQYVFDRRGLLVRVENPQGIAVTYQYEAASGKLTGVTTPDESTATIEFTTGGVSIHEPGTAARTVVVSVGGTGVGHLDSITNPDAAGSHTFDYDHRHRLIHTSWSPFEASFGYATSGGRLAWVDQGAGARFEFAPAAATALVVPVYGWPEDAGMRATLIDPRSPLYVTRLTPDARGRLLREDRPLGSTDRYERNAAGDVTLHVDPLFWRTAYTFDYGGDLIRVDHPDGSHEAFGYHQKFHAVTSAQDRNGHTAWFEYDDLGEMTATVDGEGNRTEYSYYGNGQKGAALVGLVKEVTNPRGAVTVYQYDPLRRWLRSTTDAELGQTTYEYDTNGNPAWVTDARNHTTATNYDGRNHLTSAVDALGNVTAYTYFPSGLVDRITAPAPGPGLPANVTRYAYNPRGLVVQQDEGFGTSLQVTATFDHDTAGNLTTQTTGLGPNGAAGYSHPTTTLYSYNALNQVIEEVEGVVFVPILGMPTADFSGAITRHFGSDAAGNRVWESAPGEYGYAPAATPAELQASDVLTVYHYDPAGRPYRVSEAVGKVTGGYERSSFTFHDPAGNAIVAVGPLGVRTVSGFDGNDRPTTQTEAANLPYRTRTTTTEYDPAGNVRLVTEPGVGHVTRYYYDLLDRMTAATEAYGVIGVQRTSFFRYDAVGNLTAEAHPRKYDFEVNPWTGIVLPPNWTATQLDADVTAVVTRYGYDAADRKTTAIEGANLTPAGNGMVGSLLPHATQPTTITTYDGSGNVVMVTDPRGVQTRFVYDVLGRRTVPGRIVVAVVAEFGL